MLSLSPDGPFFTIFTSTYLRKENLTFGPIIPLPGVGKEAPQIKANGKPVERDPEQKNKQRHKMVPRKSLEIGKGDGKRTNGASRPHRP